MLYFYRVGTRYYRSIPLQKTPRVGQPLFLGKDKGVEGVMEVEDGGGRNARERERERKKERNKRLIKGDMQKRGMCALRGRCASTRCCCC